MKDLTVIFLTINKVPEAWAAYHKEVLCEAIGDTPLITISKIPMDWGTNLIQDEEPSVPNIYRQVLRGAKLADTPYIAIAEDDTLYQKEHFEFRPPMDTFAYDMNRWGILTWRVPVVFYYKARISNAAMIAPRELVIESLEARFKNYPNNNIGELGKERGTVLDRKKTMFFYPRTGLYESASMVYLSHPWGLDPHERSKRKQMGTVQAYEIPYWGRAEDVVRRFV